MVDILNKYNDNVVLALVGALVYGLLFTAYQVYEYIHATFDISDSVYGSTFYRLTGLHGLHVLVGTFLLAIQLARFIYGAVFADRAVGLTTRIWYWHFVDVVWLVVFAVVYIWGSWGVIAVEDIMSAQAAERLVPSYKDVWCS
jgi:cytochrome c oxidase subunit 3